MTDVPLMPTMHKHWCGKHTNRLHELVQFFTKAEPLALTLTLKRHRPRIYKKCEICGDPSVFTATVRHTGTTTME